MSFEDYRTNRDPALAAVLAHEDEDFVLDPMQYLTDLFMAGKLEEVRSEAHRLTKDPRYQFFRFEQQFNRAGYDLLGDGQVEPALFVFGLNAELFPESPNVWDSLAEAHWKAGKTEKAVELYQKTIEMDPEGQTGANARDMLDRIRTGGK